MKRLSIFRPVYKIERAKDGLTTKFIAKGDGFSINFPDQPQSIDTGDHSRQYITKSKAAIHSITVYDLETTRTTEYEMRGELLNAVTRMSRLMSNAKELSSTTTTVCDLPAIRLVYEINKNSTYYYSVVVKNDKLYEIALNAKVNSEDLFTKFIDSFEFAG